MLLYLPAVFRYFCQSMSVTYWNLIIKKYECGYGISFAVVPARKHEVENPAYNKTKCLIGGMSNEIRNSNN